LALAVLVAPDMQPRGREGMARTFTLVLATAAFAIAATAIVALVPWFDLAYRNQGLHIAVQTTEALIGLLTGYLVLGRYWRRQQVDDLVLALAFVLLALSNLLFSAIPAVTQNGTTTFSIWSATIGRLLGAGGLAAAAFVRPVRLRLSRRQAIAMVALTVGALGAIAGLVAASESSLPQGVEVAAPDPSRPRLEGHPILLGGQLVGLALYALAAFGFARRAEQLGDRLLRWLAVGAVLAAAARVNYFLYPSVYTEWVYLGDVFRLLFYCLVLVAALGEISSYWRGVAEMSALEERRRIARDMHDGLAQELASIRRNLGSVDGDDRFVQRARSSAERALGDSRRAIAALSGPWQQPINAVLAQTTREVAEREGTELALNLVPDVELSPAEREALVMIASEAITNAARHSGAELVRVELTRRGQVRLRITDSGRGFEHEAVSQSPEGGFGMTSMRERAEAIGARFRVRARPEGGTEVEVEL
jgi:signal transduction histidine kinase